MTIACAALCIASLCLAENRDKNKDGIPDGNVKKPPHPKAEQPKKPQHKKAAQPKKKPRSDAGPKHNGGNKDVKKKEAPKKAETKRADRKTDDHKGGQKKPQSTVETPKDAASKPAKKEAASRAPKDAAKSKEPDKHPKQNQAHPTDGKPAAPFSSRRDIDWREGHQQKRIALGIRSGALTKEEVVSLEKREHEIKRLEASFRSDGHLNATERKQLHTKLDEASRMIFAGKHDTDGRQMPALRFGTNVFAKPEFLRKLEGEHLSAAEARTMAADHHRALALHRHLGHDGLTPAQREEIEREYNELLYKYFEVRDP